MSLKKAVEAGSPGWFWRRMDGTMMRSPVKRGTSPQDVKFFPYSRLVGGAIRFTLPHQGDRVERLTEITVMPDEVQATMWWIVNGMQQIDIPWVPYYRRYGGCLDPHYQWSERGQRKPERAGVSMRMSGKEYKAFMSDPKYWPGDHQPNYTWMEYTDIHVNGVEIDPSVFDEMSVKDADVVMIRAGEVVVDNEPGMGKSLTAYARKWLKEQTTAFIVVECHVDAVDEIKRVVAEHGGKVVR